MATTETDITPIGFPFPYIGIGVAPAQVITPIPSAEFLFKITAGAITVAAAGKDQKLTIICDLPRSFCYALVESSLYIRGADTADWDDNAVCTLRDALSDSDVTMPIDYSTKGVGHASTTFVIKTYVARDIPSKLVIPQMNTDGRFEIEIMNTTIDGALGAVFFFARFLRFDRNQSQFWQANYPVLTR